MNSSTGREPTIRIENLTKRYRTVEALEVHALSKIDHSIFRNEFVAILGPSGCGKTTLLKIIGDLIPPTEGRVLIEGNSAREARRKRRFSFFFQGDVTLPWLNVIRNITLPYELSGEFQRDRQSIMRKAESVIERVGLSEFQNALPRELSGGMRQRVALARGLIFDPEILLMDEPFAALDELTRTEMNLELMRIIQGTNKTVAFVTHHIPEAVFLSDRVLLMTKRPGQIVENLVIGLPRPRGPEVRHSPEFQGYVRALERHFLG